jgi:hypothetical protein
LEAGGESDATVGGLPDWLGDCTVELEVLEGGAGNRLPDGDERSQPVNNEAAVTAITSPMTDRVR